MELRLSYECIQMSLRLPISPIMKRSSMMQKHRPQCIFYSALTAKFRAGKCLCFFFCLSVTRFFSSFDNRLRIARVCFGRRSSGMALMTVRTRAMDLRMSWLRCVLAQCYPTFDMLVSVSSKMLTASYILLSFD